MYVDSFAERITAAPTLLGSDLKLYLRDGTVMSARVPPFGGFDRNDKFTFHP